MADETTTRAIGAIETALIALDESGTDENMVKASAASSALDALIAQQASEPRAMIQHFALLGMERKLAANDGKGGWRGESRFTLLAHLRDEVMELQDALNDMLHDEMADRPPRPDTVLSECADVALFAMFIADVCGALPPTDERGR